MVLSHETFNDVKKRTIRAAKDLCYGSEVVEKLKNARTEVELTRIMRTARQERQKEDY